LKHRTKFPENSLDKLRAIMVNLINRQLYSSKHLNYFDSRMLKEFNKCKKCLRDNEEVFVTRADKGQITVILNKQTYINKINKTRSSKNNYK